MYTFAFSHYHRRPAAAGTSTAAAVNTCEAVLRGFVSRVYHHTNFVRTTTDYDFLLTYIYNARGPRRHKFHGIPPEPVPLAIREQQHSNSSS